MSNIDLHFHSSYSDGKLPVSTIADLIKEKGLKYCALADHDSVAGIRELQRYLDGTGITLIPATELTALYNDTEIHLLAYDFDISVIEKVLQERNDIVRNKKIEEMKKTILLLKEHGIEVDSPTVPEEKKPVGYTLSVAICNNEKNQDLFMKKYGKRLNRDDIYYEYQAPGKSCVVERSGVTVQWLLEKLRGTVKDFIIAHPFVSPSVAIKPLNEKSIVALLSLGVDGLEVYHNGTSDEQVKWLEQIVQDKNLRYTGGSDSHGKKEDLPLGYYSLNKTVPVFRLTNFSSK